ncbi:MAG: hypothetical protein ACE37K_15515 [Planctomycetota bacterium]
MPWDPDGPGPEAERLVLGGDFVVAGDVYSPGVAIYDPVASRFERFPSPLPGFVQSVHAGDQGQLIAQRVSVFPAGYSLSSWNGTNWDDIGSFDTGVSDILFLPSGDVIVAGSFTQVDGVAAAGLARWNGSAWSPFGDTWVSQTFLPVGFPSFPVNGEGAVFDLELLANGDVVAAGVFTSIDGVVTDHVARWDGTQWNAFTTGGQLSAWVSSAVEVGGVLHIAGPLGTSPFAFWSGSGWTPHPSQPPGGITLGETPAGQLACRGASFFGVLGPAGWQLQPWTANGTSYQIARLASGSLFAAGDFTEVGGTRAVRVARFAQGWAALGRGTEAPMLAVAAAADGTLVVGGAFTSRGGQAATRIARLDGAGWADVTPASEIPVTDVANGPNGEVLAIGAFSFAGLATPVPVVRVVGNAAQPLDPAFWVANEPLALATAINGDAVLGCRDRLTQEVVLATWDGVTVSGTGLTGLVGEVRTIVVEANGDVLLGGTFAAGATSWQVVRWNGASWVGELQGLQVQGVPNTIRTMLRRSSGELVLGGDLANRLHIFDGTNVTTIQAPAPSGPVRALAELPGGDLLVGGRTLQRWNGSTWTSPAWVSGPVRDLAVAADGSVAVVGEFAVAGAGPTDSIPSAHFFRLQPACPATVVVSGQGCASTAGVVTLGSDDRPWIGTTFRSQTDGVSVGSIVLQVLGSTSASLPLAAVVPASDPACSLLVNAEMLLAPAVAGGSGSVATSLAIPVVPALVGNDMHLQSLPIVFGPGGVLASSSNALVLTVGAL